MNHTDISSAIIKNLRNDIKAGDADGGLGLAEMLLSEGPQFAPSILIEIVENVLELSVLAGSKSAKKYLEEKWPTLKLAHNRRLTNKL